ncbi:hypothetical protein, partial [Bacillus subtilis]|uniref:hypothetical protein n=1 Tax=Bacillus subtilis TaxID=1423 RepID=UPI003C14F4B1
RYRFLPIVMVLFLVFFSGSRSAFLNIGLQLVILGAVLYRLPEYRPTLLQGMRGAMAITVVLLAIYGNSVVEAVSKK